MNIIIDLVVPYCESKETALERADLILKLLIFVTKKRG